MAERFSEEVKKDLSPLEHHEWEGIKAGSIVGVKERDGMFRVEEVILDEGLAILQEVNEKGQSLNDSFDEVLEKLTKDIA